jgi:hypothetical protein
MKIYPNPSNGKNIHVFFFIIGKENVELAIYDAVGQKVYSQIVVPANGSILTDLVIPKPLTPNVYIVVVNNGIDTFRSKLIVK